MAKITKITLSPETEARVEKIRIAMGLSTIQDVIDDAAECFMEIIHRSSLGEEWAKNLLDSLMKEARERSNQN